MVLKISRKNILKDSIFELNNNYEIDTYEMQILYIDEEGRDLGGLIKDWMTSVGIEIINSGVFKVVPSGNYLTIDDKNEDNEILQFAGKIIAIEFNNNLNLNIKLTSFIWKLLLNERITLDDMEEYDQYIYQSLKWISEKSVAKMEEYFVDPFDEELIPNGRNIKLTNENKKEYVKQMLKKIFIGKNEKLFRFLKNGFDTTIDKYEVKRYSAKELRSKIIGKEKIDIEDWKENTRSQNDYNYDEYDNEYNDDNNYDRDDENYDRDDKQYYIDLFFRIISKWSQENLRKLLKFVTGSPNVPINGFSNLNGGKFTIQVNNDHKKLPEAHTCFNTLVLPCNNTEKQLEKKLLLAIEVVDFGLS